MEEAKKLSHDEVKKTIAQIYQEMEETLKGMDEIIKDENTLEEEKDEPIPIVEEEENLDESLFPEEEEQENVLVIAEKFEEPAIEPIDSPIEDRILDDGPKQVNHDYENVQPKEMIEEDVLYIEPQHLENVRPEIEEVDNYNKSDIDTIIDHSQDNFENVNLNEDVLEMVREIKSEIGRVVVGYEDIVENLLIALLSNGHVLLEGVPGIAKTTLAKTFTSILGMDCQRIQFTPDMLPQDITGHFFYNQKINEFELRRGPIFSNLLLADEINRTTPKTQSALLECMEEKQVTIEGNTFSLPKPFMVIATINPIEHDGVYQLPMAQADRFMLKVNMGYIPKERELELLKMKANGSKKDNIPLKVFDLAILKQAYESVYADASIVEYINEIISSTRNSELISIGASPRASEHLLYASKAKACLNGRDYVIPDDIKNVVYEILNHRLVNSPDIDPDEHSSSDVIMSLVEDIKVPLEKR